MEALFAGAGGVLTLGEPLTVKLAVGGALMLAGIIVSQPDPSPGEAAGRGTRG